MNKSTDNTSPEAAHAADRRWWPWLFYAGWTVFASLAVWWLVRRSGEANVGTNWFIGGDEAAKASLAERIANWLKLADLNFHGAYPWILLAPYVAWLGARFHLERGQSRVSLPVHLAGCALFVTASYALAAYSDWGRHIVVAYSTQIRTTNDGKQNSGAKTHQNDEFTIGTDAPSTPWAEMWGGSGEGQTAHHGQAFGADSVVEALPPPGIPGLHGELVFRRHFLGSPLLILDPFAYAFIIGIVHTIRFYQRSREREGRAAALEAQLTKARLNALQAQLHPHFLFNALNAISTLLRRDTRAAQDALASLSELLRLALCHSTEPEVTLREDLEFLRRYVEIQETRLGERLHFEEVITPEALDCLVPALFLQPLVENAIRHGIEPSPNAGKVSVIVQPEGERLLVTVEDNGAGLSNQENERDGGIGIGLQNLRSRLESLYGAEQRFDSGPRPEGGFTVRVELPLRHARRAEKAAVVS